MMMTVHEVNVLNFSLVYIDLAKNYNSNESYIHQCRFCVGYILQIDQSEKTLDISAQ